MDSEPPLSGLFGETILLVSQTSDLLLGGFVLFVLIICSALVSGSEIAFFSLSPNDLHTLEDDDAPSSDKILALRQQPRVLLATILISNNFINIAIVLVSNFLLRNVIGESELISIGKTLQHVFGLENIISARVLSEMFNFLISIAGVTFILVLFGEVIPKIYANINNLSFAKMMSTPIKILSIVFRPFSTILVNWTTSFENRIIKARSAQTGTSKEDIDKAIELTVGDSENSDQEVDMLKGIVKFGDVSAKQIMRSRVDVIALEKNMSFLEVLNIAKESGYSRIPVYTEDFDNIDGILYVKDLLGHTDEDENFRWQPLIRENTLYVPESKKIDDLLNDFQQKRTHMAIVVDEYGGSAGLITLEDIMEEVVGEIRDEFDEEEEVDYIKLSENNYIFEGKSLLNDVCRIIGINTDFFDAVRGDADSLAGLMIEMTGTIPRQEKEIKYNDIVFKIISVSKRRVEKVNLRIT